MPESPPERRPPPLVADPAASLDPPHRTQPRPAPQPWGLRLVALLLAAGLVGVSAMAWEERQLLHAELSRLEGRFATLQTALDGLDPGARLAEFAEAQQALMDDQAHLDARLAEQHEVLEGLRQAWEEAPEPQALAEALARLEAQQGTLETWLSGSRDSLDALETLGVEGRAGLAERIDGLARESAQAREALSARQEAQEARIEEAQAQWQQELARLEAAQAQGHEALARHAETAAPRLDDLEARLAEVDAALEPLRDHPDNAREAQAALTQRIEALQAEVRELRRSLLATEARLEMLSP